MNQHSGDPASDSANESWDLRLYVAGQTDNNLEVL